MEKERNEGGGGAGIDPLPGAKLSFTLGRFPREKLVFSNDCIETG